MKKSSRDSQLIEFNAKDLSHDVRKSRSAILVSALRSYQSPRISGGGKMLTISLPVAMMRNVQKVAKTEHRTVTELLMEAFRQYQAQRNLRTLAQAGRRAVKAKGLRASDLCR